MYGSNDDLNFAYLRTDESSCEVAKSIYKLDGDLPCDDETNVEDGLPAIAIVGIVVGSLILLLIVVLAFRMFMKN